LLATFHDLALWILLTILLSLVGSTNSYAGNYKPLVTIAYVVVWITGMALVVRPALKWLIKTSFWARLNPLTKMTFEMIGLITCAFLAELIEIRDLLGAIIWGATLPKKITRPIEKRVEALTMGLLIPVFFGQAGLSIHLEMSTYTTIWSYVGAVGAIVCGQFLGSVGIARFVLGKSWATSFTIFAYMLTKGIVELVILSILFTKGVISTPTYSALVLAGITTTALTKPIVLLIKIFSKEPEVRIYENFAFKRVPTEIELGQRKPNVPPAELSPPSVVVEPHNSVSHSHSDDERH